MSHSVYDILYSQKVHGQALGTSSSLIFQLQNPNKKLARKAAIKSHLDRERTAKRSRPLKKASPTDILNIHQQWVIYFTNHLKNTRNKEKFHSICRADFHGAYVTVIRSNTPDLINCSGYILKETKNNFLLYQLPKAHQKLVKKANNVFLLTVGSTRVIIFGSGINYRSSGRTIKK